MNRYTKAALLGATTIASSAFAQAESVESRIAKLENEIFSLKEATESAPSLSLASWAEKTSIGGYGELHLNLEQDEAAQIDFHRFVIFINHNFNDRIRFVSELEIEHAFLDGSPDGEIGSEGAVELEQAYVEADLTDSLQGRAGLFLVPVGILNEIHEPPTFYGVERNTVENRIIPTTWWEGGLALTKKYDSGLTIDTAVTSGLRINANTGNIRSGRQRVSNANAENVAFTARAAYTGIAGLRLTAFAQYNNDILEGSASTESGLLSGATVEYTNGGFGLKALYARWDIDGLADTVPGAEDQFGYYIEPSYKFSLGETKALGVFARYEDITDFNGSGEERSYEATTVGVNYWPIDNVVFKADYQFIRDDSDRANFGVGYQF